MTGAADFALLRTRFVGSRAPRIEDDRLLTGRGEYVADVDIAGINAYPYLYRNKLTSSNSCFRFNLLVEQLNLAQHLNCSHESLALVVWVF